MIDIGNGETVPEVIYTYEKGPDGKIHRKKKRLIKKSKKDELSDIQRKEIDGAFKLFDKDGSGNINRLLTQNRSIFVDHNCRFLPNFHRFFSEQIDQIFPDYIVTRVD